MASGQAAWSRPGLSPAPGALTTWEQEAKSRSLATLSSHEPGGTEKRQGGTLWRVCGSVTPPTVRGPTDVLSYQQKSYSPSFGEE